jgi:hypothetical protein
MLEEGGEPTAGLGPGNANLLDAMLGTGTARHVRLEDRLELTGVQVPPASRLGVVARTNNAAFRAKQRGAFGSSKVDGDRLAWKIEFDMDNDPRLRKVENLGVEVAVTHGRSPGVKSRISPTVLLTHRVS